MTWLTYIRINYLRKDPHIFLVGLFEISISLKHIHYIPRDFLEIKSNEQNRFFQFYPWTNVKGWSKEAFHWEKKENLVLIWSWHRYSKAWISTLLTLYLHFIWSGSFSRLIFFIYLLLHDCINLHYEEENLFWNKPRYNCIWIFLYYFDCILNLTNYVLPFWWWFKLGFQFVNTTLSH